jgi:very-short-patch-repair endonuclease
LCAAIDELIIEVERAAYDSARNQERYRGLNAPGYRVLRFWKNDVDKIARVCWRPSLMRSVLI